MILQAVPPIMAEAIDELNHFIIIILKYIRNDLWLAAWSCSFRIRAAYQQESGILKIIQPDPSPGDDHENQKGSQSRKNERNDHAEAHLTDFGKQCANN